MSEQRKLAAVMFTDIAGYTALMSKDEQKALAVLEKNRILQKSLAKKHNGEFLKEMGDGTLLCFQSALDAVRCAMEIQESVKDDADLNLRIGIHLGDIVFREGDVFGDGVNVASRIEGLADKGGICFSEHVYQSVKNQTDINALFLDEKKLKHVDQPIKIYAIQNQGMNSTLGERDAQQNQREEKSIIVLPFDDMSPDKDNEYFSDGLTEEIITDLSHIHDLLVISRSSAMTFKGTKKKVTDIASEVNVRYVLEGSVRKAGNNLRITAQLIDAVNDAHLWAEKYSGTLDDVFDIQEKVSRSIADALKIKLTPAGENYLNQRPLENAQAFECYLRAKKDFWGGSKDVLERAIQEVKNGLAIVGENELLYWTMGRILWQCINIGVQDDRDYLREVKTCIQKIFVLNKQSHYGHSLQGWICYKQGDYRNVLKHFKKVLLEDPHDVDALIMLQYYNAMAGKISEAERIVDLILKLDPLTPFLQLMPGWLYLIQGRFDQALQIFKKVFEMDSQNSLLGMNYVYMLLHNQQPEQAIAIIDTFSRKDDANVCIEMAQFLMHSFRGEKEEAQATVSDNLKITAGKDDFFSLLMADCYAMIDEKHEAFNWLEHAVNYGWINYPFLNEYDPFLHNIRGEERFKKLMKRVKKEWENFEV